MFTAEASSDSEDPDFSRETGERVLPAPVSAKAGSRTSSGLFTREFRTLLGVQAAYGFSFSMFVLLPKSLAVAGVTPSRIGLVMASFGPPSIVTIPLLGRITGYFGRRRVVVAANLALAAAAIGLALSGSLAAALTLRIIDGITWGILFSTALSLAADLSPPDRTAQAIGLTGGASLIMNAIAPALGEPLADRFGYSIVFLLSAGAALVGAALARRLPERVAIHELRAAAAGNTPAPVNASSRVPTYVVLGMLGLAASVLFSFLAPFALSRGVHAIRSFFIAYTIAALTVRLLGGRRVDRIGHRRVAMVAVVLYGAVIAAAGIVGPSHLVALGLAFGVAHGACFPALMALLVHQTPLARRSVVLGIANASMSSGVAVVFAAGVFVGKVGYPIVFGVIGALTSASMLLLRRRGASSR